MLPGGSASPLATIRNLASRLVQLTTDDTHKSWAKEIAKLAEILLSRYRAEEGVRAIAWRIAPDVIIEEAGSDDGQFSYRIVSGGNELSHYGEWQVPLASDRRDDDYLCNHRWSSYEKALIAFRSLQV